MKNSIKILMFVAVAILFSSCAHVQPIQECLKNVETIHGFWFGLWNGMTAVPAFIVSLFSNDITVYATNNNGGWYNFGFLLGIGAFAKGASYRK
jgi:hypothetical protein